MNANLITKVYFPRVILPTSAAFSGLVDFGIGCVLLFGMIVYYGIAPEVEAVDVAAARRVALRPGACSQHDARGAERKPP